MRKSNVVVLDLMPESNFGDLVLQSGLLRLIRAKLPAARLTASVMLGANQIERLSFDYPSLTSDGAVEVVTELRPTYYKDVGGFTHVLAEAANALSLGLAAIWLAIARRSPRIARRLLRRRYRATLDAIRDADVVVWKGKNFRDRKSRLLELYRAYSRLYMPRVCHAFGKDVVCVGVSVWPVRGRLTRSLLRSTLGRCVFIGVRETESFEQVTRLLDDGPPVALVPDLSLAWLKDQAFEYSSSLGGDSLSIALTLMDWSEFGRAARNNYVESIALFLETLRTRCELTVWIVPQVKKEWESISDITRDLLDALDKPTRRRVEVIKPVEDPDELLDLYRRADLLVATRMHSAIFALSVGTPVIAIPYDVGSKWSVLRDLGVGDLMVPYDRVTSAALLEHHQALVDSGAEIMERVRTTLEDQISRLATNLGPLA